MNIADKRFRTALACERSLGRPLGTPGKATGKRLGHPDVARTEEELTQREQEQWRVDRAWEVLNQFLEPYI
jgi:hypothetical protein